MMGAPNILSVLALVAWPAVAVLLFRALPLERALVWSILVPYLFLPPPPAGFDFPLLPPFNKTSIPNLTALAVIVLLLRQKVAVLPESPLARILLVFFLVSPVATVLTNLDPVVFGVKFIPALRIHDSLASVVTQGIALLPFFLARQFLASEQAQREILLALVLGGLVYSIPILLEVRLSPQLNIWIYGYFQHDFQQMMRQGGFRPIVFLYHGIWVAFFVMTTVVAAVGLWRAARGGRAAFLVASGYLMVMLVLCKTLGALLYGIVLAPIVWLFGQRMQVRLALLMAAVAVTYPLLRGAELVPIEAILDQARAVSEDRAGSLGYRFDMEGLLLDRASEKPWFGWGGWGRSFLYNPEDGSQITVSDGRWVIVIGFYGWLGYIVEFGLLALPIFLIARQMRRLPPEAVSPYLGPLTLLLGVNMIDMLPNATLIPFTWLIAGALLGHAEALAAGRDLRTGRAAAPRPAPAPRVRTLL